MRAALSKKRIRRNAFSIRIPYGLPSRRKSRLCAHDKLRQSRKPLQLCFQDILYLSYRHIRFREGDLSIWRVRSAEWRSAEWKAKLVPLISKKAMSALPALPQNLGTKLGSSRRSFSALTAACNALRWNSAQHASVQRMYLQIHVCLRLHVAGQDLTWMED